MDTFLTFQSWKQLLSSKCLFVCQSSKPISLLESYLSPIMPIGYWNHAYHPSYLSPIMTISYHTNQPSCQSTIMPISNPAYKPSYPSAIMLINNHNYKILKLLSKLFSIIWDFSACLFPSSFTWSNLSNCCTHILKPVLVCASLNETRKKLKVTQQLWLEKLKVICNATHSLHQLFP